MEKKIIVLTGPTASGKTTTETALANRWGLTRIVGHTTREPRLGEINGVHYHFVSPEEMALLIENGEMVETNVFLGNTYGTSKKEIQTVLEDDESIGCVIVLDPNGLGKIAETFPNFVFSCYFHHDVYVLTKRYMDRIELSLKDVDSRDLFCGFSNESQLNRYINLIHCHREWIGAACYDLILDERALAQTPDEIADEIVKAAFIFS